MSASTLEVADIFRTQGQVWRQVHAGHISLAQLKVMSAIEACRSTAIGWHVLRCSSCDHQQIAYNSCLMALPRVSYANALIGPAYWVCFPTLQHQGESPLFR
jgi:hypothetical protein